MTDYLPPWAHEIIDLAVAKNVRDGVLHSLFDGESSGIDYYRSVDGAHMHERANVSYAMSTLDTAAYRERLQAIRPASLDALIVDVGGGDGRNALPWLEWGYRRVVVVDPIVSGLHRFRSRVLERNPEWLDNLLLIEADARAIPLISQCAAHVQAIESLYYLNESYEDGLCECVRVLSGSGQLIVSERDYEGGLLTSLLYGNIRDWLAQSKTRDVWDGVAGLRVRSRCFTSNELDAVLNRNGLSVVSHCGISAFALILGFLRANDKLTAQDEASLSDVHSLLYELGQNGSMRRCHFVVAEKSAHGRDNAR